MSGLTLTSGMAVGSSNSGFSYASLEPAQVDIARAAADAIRTIHKQAIPAIGRHLLTAKEALPHGAFTAWAEQELGINSRTARNYMQAASWLMGKPETVAVLPPTVLYALSAPGVPDALVQGVLVEAASGTPLNPTVIQAKLAAAKAEQTELKAAQRRKPDLTVDELRARKKRQQQRRDAERDREAAAHEAKRLERESRLKPLLDQLLAAITPAILEGMVAALTDWQDQRAFLELLKAAADGAAA